MFERLVVSPSNFAEKSRCWEGNAMVGDFERLAQEFVNPGAKLFYRVCGQQDARGRPHLLCEVKGSVEMICQRCLKPVEVRIETDRQLYLASSEEEAERLEATLVDLDIEVMVTGQSLDLAGLIEDEVLLGLPLVPMHEHCDMDSLTEI
jgi:uncharacterized protein